MGSMVDKIQLLPTLIPVLIVAATLHELAHAYVAKWLGDMTAAKQGRLTLNPIRHLDPVGSTMFAVTFLLFPFVFGWARPVPVLPHNFRNPKVGMALVAVAGPLTNVVIALAIVAAVVHTGLNDATIESDYLYGLVFYAISINIVLSVFNMLPIPPLDGSRVVGAFLPRTLHEGWTRLDQYGMIILFAIFIFASAPLQQVMIPAINWMWQLLFAVNGVQLAS